jgi:hypothetical protein
MECSGTVEVGVGDEELFRRRLCFANDCVALRGPVELDTALAMKSFFKEAVSWVHGSLSALLAR